jgi:hypothetical protein
VSLRTRNGRECSDAFPELAAIAETLGSRSVTLDVELVCLRDDGRPDFARLRSRLAGSTRNRRPATLHLFAVLHLDDCSTRSLPYRERRILLDELALSGPACRTPTSVVVQQPEAFVTRVAELGLEGVVAKHLDSSYLPGRRTGRWIKHKVVARSDWPSPGSAACPTAEPRRCSSPAGCLTTRRKAPGRSNSGSEARSSRSSNSGSPSPARRRGAVAWYPAEVSIIASLHGLPDGPVRDAILRGVVE